MKLIIDIHEKDYQAIKNGHIPFSVLDVITNGTPLPKGHGRLGDLDKLEKEMNDYIKSIPLPYHEAERLVLLMNHFDDAPTIVEADKAESEG